MNGFLSLSILLLLSSSGLAADPDDDQIRGTFRMFVAAQNAHDADAVGDLLLDSPDFLWITKGTPVWGRSAALARFQSLYAGTWRLDPDTTALRIIHIRSDVVHLVAPVQFTIGAPGHPPQTILFYLNQVLVRTERGWKVSSILPLPAAPPQEMK